MKKYKIIITLITAIIFFYSMFSFTGEFSLKAISESDSIKLVMFGLISILVGIGFAYGISFSKKK